MISFARPWLLLLLLIPIGLMVWEWRRRGHPLVLPFDHGRQRPGRFLKRLVDSANLLPQLLLAVVIVVLARPQRTALPKDERNLTNILFCMDVSGSMTAQFGSGKRSDAAIAAIQEFTTYRPGDAFGLTIFGNEVLHWVPVTKDLSALRQSTPFLRPEKMPQYLWGTQIGKALREVRKVLTAQADGDRMVILISDGQSFDLHGGQAEEIGHQLYSDGIVVYYIHVAEGQPQEETFTIASLTGGQAFSAGDPAALKEVFQRIDRMQSAKMKPAAPQAVDDYRPFALAGMVFGGAHLLCLFGLRYTPW